MREVRSVGTNIVSDDDLIRKAMKYTGLKTKKEVVHHALAEVVHRSERKKILSLKGKLHWEGDLKKMRRLRTDDSS